jgi:hypothetical protein
MNRFSLALAAAAISAIAATGVMALQAVGDDQGPSTQADREKLAKCLRTERDDRKCEVDPQPKQVKLDDLLACLRAHGLQPPTEPAQLKMWILRTPGAKACIEVPKDAGAPAPGCGEQKPEVIESRSDSAPS